MVAKKGTPHGRMAKSLGRITYGFIPDVRFISGVPEVSFTMRTFFLLTGHGSLSEFLVGRNLMEVSSCVCGEQVETAMHMLCTCPLYANIRNLDALQITLHENNHDVAIEHAIEPK